MRSIQTKSKDKDPATEILVDIEEILSSSLETMQERLNLLYALEQIDLQNSNDYLDKNTAMMLAACGKRELWNQLCCQKIYWIDDIELLNISYPKIEKEENEKLSVFGRIGRWFKKLKEKRKTRKKNKNRK